MTQTAELDRIAQTDPPSPEQRAAIEAAEIRAWGALREPAVYAFESEHSYFRDVGLRRLRGDQRAAERLEKHGKQMARLPGEQREAPKGVHMEFRIPPSRVAGRGGEFAPPLWLNELFATAPRATAVLQLLIPTFVLPPGCSSVNFPRITRGTEASPQPDGTPSDDQDILTAQCASPAVPFVGASDWSLQALEQSPAGVSLDWVVFTDLGEALDADIELQLLMGLGTPESEQFYGLLNLAGTNKISFTEAAEPKKMYPYLGRLMAQSGVKRKRPPQAWLMNTSRLGWLALTEDAERPLLFSDNPNSDFPVVDLAGIGVYLNDSIPNTLGAGKEDTIITCRPSEMVMFATEPTTSATESPARVMEDVLSGTLGVRFQLRRTIAAILGRYPTGISYLEGKGMEVQEGFK